LLKGACRDFERKGIVELCTPRTTPLHNLGHVDHGTQQMPAASHNICMRIAYPYGKPAGCHATPEHSTAEVAPAPVVV